MTCKYFVKSRSLFTLFDDPHGKRVLEVSLFVKCTSRNESTLKLSNITLYLKLNYYIMHVYCYTNTPILESRLPLLINNLLVYLLFFSCFVGVYNFLFKSLNLMRM